MKNTIQPAYVAPSFTVSRHLQFFLLSIFYFILMFQLHKWQPPQTLKARAKNSIIPLPIFYIQYIIPLLSEKNNIYLKNKLIKLAFRATDIHAMQLFTSPNINLRL